MRPASGPRASIAARNSGFIQSPPWLERAVDLTANPTVDPYLDVRRALTYPSRTLFDTGSPRDGSSAAGGHRAARPRREPRPDRLSPRWTASADCDRIFPGHQR